MRASPTADRAVRRASLTADFASSAGELLLLTVFMGLIPRFFVFDVPFSLVVPVLK